MTATTQATFSLASEAGHLPSKSPDGEQLTLFGPDHAHARHSVAPENSFSAPDAVQEILCHALDELATSYAETAATHGLPMPATYGRSSGGSSPSGDRQSSSESRLRRQMDAYGSPEYVLRWKSWAMPLSAPICALRASAPRTSGNASTGAPKGWATPRANDAEKRGQIADDPRNGLVTDANLAGWPTARANDGTGDAIPPGRQGGMALKSAVTLAGWPTPTSRDWRSGKASPETLSKNARPLNEAVLAALDGPYAILADPGGWPIAVMIDGDAYQLNPDFSLWLMGYPDGWECYAEPETQSTHG